MILVAMPVMPRTTYMMPRMSSMPTRAYIRSVPSKFKRKVVIKGHGRGNPAADQGSPMVLLTMYISSWTNTMDRGHFKGEPEQIL